MSDKRSLRRVNVHDFVNKESGKAVPYGVYDVAADALSGTSFNDRKELMAHIDAFIAAYNVDAKSFVWTKSEVHQKRLKPCFADL